MVDESLIAYLLSKIPSPLVGEGKGEGDTTESRLRKLLTYTEEPHKFSETDVTSLINAIDNAKILDPACGSGAFPMGVLHKMVHILHKLDPDNERWKQRQIDKVEELIRSAEKIDNSTAREQIIKDLEVNKQNIEDAFEHNELDYGRKLYLIENCIYGIDIQPIAVQIAKLRFFISLIVDQRADTYRKNLGIRPLPNLETKFVAANTLIGIEQPAQLLLRNPEIDIKEKELKQVREKHFSARTPKTKDKYRLEDARLRAELAEFFKNDGFSAETTHKLSHWDPYDQNSSADFFDSEWMFGIKDGFDVVIGNPPYVDSETMTKSMPELRKKISMSYSTAKGNWDLYVTFWELGFKLLLDKGNAVFITPNKWLSIKYGEKLRGFLHAFVNRVGNCDLFDVFEAGNSPVIVFINKAEMENEIHIDVFNSDYIIQETVDAKNSILNYGNWGILLSTNVKLLLKISHCKKRVADDYFAENPFTVSEAYEVTDFLQDLGEIVLFNSKKYFRFVNTGTIDKYLFLWGRKYTTYIKKKYLLPVIKRASFLENFPKRYKQMDSTKIIISGMRHFECMLDDEANIIAGKSTVILKSKRKSNYKEILGILNSKLISFYIKESYGALGIDGGINFTADLVENLPLPDPDKLNVQNIENVVDQILTAKQKDPQADTTELENRIDVMVYKLYDLTYKEVKIVDPEFEMIEKDYTAFPMPQE